jgi:hypothetical protein
VHSDDKVRAVFALAKAGHAKAEIARRTDVSRAQVREWLRTGVDAVLASPMRATSTKKPHDPSTCGSMLEVPIGAYAYLLGQYLGDGCISPNGRGHPRLRISTCDAYPGIRRECIAAIHAIAPTVGVSVIQREGCSEVGASSRHWPCLFPQHGPGTKHERPIVLDTWQRRYALDIRPDLFIRGLIHSDGCRVINRVTVRGKRYEYPRYFFGNESDDIRALFLDACEQLGISARHNNRNSVSVARRDSVAILDSIVGPKT